MDVISEKIENFRNNCYQMAQNEAERLKKEIDNEINENIKIETKKYQEEIEKNFNKRIDKIEKSYNSEIFNQEIEYKQNITEKQKELQEDLKSEIYTRIEKFVDTENYKKFLFDNIEQVIKSCDLHNSKQVVSDSNLNNVKLYLTQRDYNKYKDEVKTMYQCTIETMENIYIGGAIGETKNVLVDNSLKTLIQENIRLVLG